LAAEPQTSGARILVADPISEAGVAALRSAPGFEVVVKTGLPPGELTLLVREFDALVVRSATRVTAEVLRDSGRLRVIGRAGTGVDNIDLDAATAAGVVVLNTPGGNSVAAAEHTISLLLALARNVPQANADVRAGRWDRKTHVGVEVAGKALGIVGLGRIGREVARRAQGLRMEVLGFEKFVSQMAAVDLGISLLPLEDLLRRCDFLTLHLPLSEETRHLIDAEALRKMKRGARIVNCARGGLVDEAALYESIASGHLAGAALDVFETEPPADRRLVEHPRVVATPHLGASTFEAQERVGTEIAEKIRAFLESGVMLDAVNFPAFDRDEYAALRPLLGLAEKLGAFLAQVAEGGVVRLAVRCQGNVPERALQPLAMAAATGLLAPVLSGGVSYVNALRLAAERGIAVEQSRSTDPTPLSRLVRVRVVTDHEEVAAAGTLLTDDLPRIVEVDGTRIEASPSGHLLFFRNLDVPGVVGQIGTILGHASVNIAGIHLGRATQGGSAVSIINVDGPVPPAALGEIRAMREVLQVRTLEL
jgi:D-3-phosphoglycerate dehydrogenase